MIPVYFQTEYDARRIGVDVVPVSCDKCGCHYYFELARQGSGHAVAVYGFGKDAATQRSFAQAEEDLQARLADEAELVPCPKCHWINKSLVAGFARTKHDDINAPVFIAALVSYAIFWGIGWYIGEGPAEHHKWINYFKIGGLIVTLAGVVIYVGVLNLMRRFSNPNRDYPMPPRVPRGTPPALMIDPVDGKLKSVRAEYRVSGGASAAQEFQLGRSTIPDRCCVCLREAQVDEHAFRALYSNSLQEVLEFPRCAECAKADRRQQFVLWPTFALLMLLGVGLLLYFKAQPLWFLLIPVAIGTLIAAGLISTYFFPKPVKASFIDKSRGILGVRGRNPGYRLEDAR